jgi:hypothetical protein
LSSRAKKLFSRAMNPQAVSMPIVRAGKHDRRLEKPQAIVRNWQFRNKVFM